VSGTLRVLRAETYRVLRHRTTWIALAFLCAVPLLFVFGAHIADLAERAQKLAAGRSVETVVDEGDAWAPFVDAWKAGLTLATLLLLIHASRSIAGDRDRGSLRLGVTRSVRRRDLIWGRALLGVLLVAGSIAVSGISAYLMAQAYYDFGGLVEDGYEIMGAAELRTEALLAIASAFPALIATYAFGLLLSSMLRSATAAVASALALFLAFDLFKDIMGDAQYWVFAAFTPSFVDTSAMKEMSGLARGFADAGFPTDLWNQSLVLPLPEALLMLVAASLVLSKKAL